ncbi:Glycosyltransferase Family 35 protein [Glomus cerebriforme]|uniref:Alpha-1,4 glucan phosphorylase n=1 Tax=Glomus cerebriforme TaxID=658196 RepID=A0A397TPU6_9GLOM|nr:Glycosyltransferase Family 35 protein [Glomus cerebriforme]
MSNADSTVGVSTNAKTKNAKARVRTLTGIPKIEMSEIPKETLALWEKYGVGEADDKESFQKSFIRHVTTTLARSVYNIDNFSAYQATAHTVRDRLIKRWNDTQQAHTEVDPKRVYYLSLEFLLGRSLDNALLNLGLKENYGEGVKELGFRMEDILDEEVDAALGNGGLGRLAACYMDSLATLDYPAWGYGLRYTYGIFQQRLKDGFQVELPDYWLNFDNPWELPRLDVTIDVKFCGTVNRYTDETGKVRHVWVNEDKDTVQAVAYDVPIPGYGTKNCINIRLWSSKPKRKFNLKRFNEGQYEQAVQEQMEAENITAVLYPNDNHMVGKELRLKQQYFWVSASLSDIVRRFKKSSKPWDEFSYQVAIQLNDTHPTLAIVELQRILVDLEGIDWDEAWKIVTNTFAFTNHTILPEAMERWPVPMVQYLLPRHMQIIFDINLFFLQAVERAYPDDRELLAKLSIIEESTPQFVRMAHLAIVGSHRVNGVAALHSELLKKTIFKDFVRYYGDEKFDNKTNGITPRRWLHQANPKLSELITEALGSKNWLKNLELLKGLKSHVDKVDFRKRWVTAKHSNKVRLAEYIKKSTGIIVNPNALFDVQVKRIHEYKRQFMNILGVIHRYNALKKLTSQERADIVPRVVIFGGKAAPGYYIAKLVIKLINSVADVINNDNSIEDTLKVVFIPDYNVSVAEIIIPASDISQHISTAGTEASGTSNMKFVLNGGLILGTVDGANIEIHEEIGDDNIFMFGNLADQVDDLRHAHRYRNIPIDPSLQAVINDIESGHFGDSRIFAPLINTITHGKDYYLISDDFQSYLDAQKLVDEAYKDKEEWTKKSILCSANMGKFSSDRAIQEYAEQIWNIDPVPAKRS